jgi:hypothetical protein
VTAVATLLDWWMILVDGRVDAHTLNFNLSVFNSDFNKKKILTILAKTLNTDIKVERFLYTPLDAL